MSNWARLVAMVLSVGMYGYAFYLSFLARAAWSMFMWGLCIFIATAFLAIFGLFVTEMINQEEYSQKIRPLLFPSNLILWVLPCLDWIWRLKQANEAGHTHVVTDV